MNAARSGFYEKGSRRCMLQAVSWTDGPLDGRSPGCLRGTLTSQGSTPGLYLFFVGGHICPVALISSQTLTAPKSACAFLDQMSL